MIKLSVIALLTRVPALWQIHPFRERPLCSLSIH